MMEKNQVTKGNCNVINLFKSKGEDERKRCVQAGMANIICRTESNQMIKYKRVR